MEGKIYIDGVFGEGITLKSVQEQVSALGELTILNVDFNSGGGDVDVGYAVYDYLDSLKKSGVTVNTNIVGVCASITTVPFLAGEKRTRTPHSSLMIHNPWMQPNAPMEAVDFEEAGEYLREEENKLASFYAKSLSADVNEIKELMRVETRLDVDQSKSIGFINAKSIEYRAVASIKLNETYMNDKNTSLFKDIQASIDKLSKFVKGSEEPVKAADLTLSDGTVVVIDTEDGEFVGKSITMTDGSALEDGIYELEGGIKITVLEGMVSEVAEVEEGDNAEDLKSENESLKAELESLKASQVESASALEEAEKVNAEMKASIEDIATKVSALEVENKAMASVVVGGDQPLKAAIKTPKASSKTSGDHSFFSKFIN